ncbi:MAG: hypothetical protein AAF492_09695 [Verrucomicrobiota bacterium]
MRKMKWLFVPIMIVGLSCVRADDTFDSVTISRDQLNARPKPEPAKPVPVIMAQGKKPKAFKRDDFWLEKINLKGDILGLRVTSGGGCKPHIYKLVVLSPFKESSPVEVNLLLSHNANNDPCEAIVGKNLKFDLTPLKTAFKKAYPGSKGEIRLNIFGRDPQKPLKQVTYTFSS